MVACDVAVCEGVACVERFTGCVRSDAGAFRDLYSESRVIIERVRGP